LKARGRPRRRSDASGGLADFCTISDKILDRLLLYAR
jgi:hypothetical protein